MDETRDYLADLISCKRTIFKYEGFPKVPRFGVHGGIRLDRNYLEIDIKEMKPRNFSNHSLNAFLELVVVA